MKLRLMMAAVVCVAVAAAGGAYAQFSPKDAVAARVNAYRETGAAFKSINDQLKSPTPAKILLKSSIRTISASARDQYTWFPAGSGPESGLKTKAKAAIWSDAAGFRAAQARLQKEADLMTKAIDGGDKAQMLAQAKALGQACAACHAKYREKE